MKCGVVQVYRSRSDAVDHLVVSAPYRSQSIIDQSTSLVRQHFLQLPVHMYTSGEVTSRNQVRSGQVRSGIGVNVA